jgi:hypothetical protein
MMSSPDSRVLKASPFYLEGYGDVFSSSRTPKISCPSLEGNGDVFSELQHSKDLHSFPGRK